jgi:hypothetical protein
MGSSDPAAGEGQEVTDFLSTQVVFGNGSRPAVGLDVLATKVAVDFQGLTSETGDNCVKRCAKPPVPTPSASACSMPRKRSSNVWPALPACSRHSIRR